MFKRLLYMLGLTIAAAQACAASDKPTCLLKNVQAVSYALFLHSVFKSPACNLDYSALTISADFTANQSTQLRFIKSADHFDEVKERYDKIPQPTFSKKVGNRDRATNGRLACEDA